jgi:hypothetical protein
VVQVAASTITLMQYATFYTVAFYTTMIVEIRQEGTAQAPSSEQDGGLPQTDVQPLKFEPI